MAENHTPLASVVMPIYNRADLLPKTIASILNQDFDDFELLIVDDGSTDNTAEIITQIQEQDPRLRYVKLPQNQGIGFARDAGLKHISGKYSALADSDDLWLPGKLKLQIEIMEKYPEIDILFSDWWNINHITGEEVGGFTSTRAGMEHLVTYQKSNLLFIVERGVETGILRKNFVQPATMVLRAEVFNKVGSFDTAQVTHPDHEFAFRAAVLGANFAYIHQPLIERHKYQSSVTANPFSSNMRLLEALSLCRQTCKVSKRFDLLNNIRDAEHRIWRGLIRTHAENRELNAVIRTYWYSLKYGFSLRTLGFFLLGLGGTSVMSNVMKFRARSSQAT